MRFTLNINIGNAAMTDPYDIAQALRRTAERVEHGYTEGPISDVNGNTVGEFTTERD